MRTSRCGGLRIWERHVSTASLSHGGGTRVGFFFVQTGNRNTLLGCVGVVCLSSLLWSQEIAEISEWAFTAVQSSKPKNIPVASTAEKKP